MVFIRKCKSPLGIYRIVLGLKRIYFSDQALYKVWSERPVSQLSRAKKSHPLLFRAFLYNI